MKKLSFRASKWSFLNSIGVFIGLIALNVLAGYLDFQFDCTDDQTYSLSENTRALLQKLPGTQNVTLTLYFSQSHDQVSPQAKLFAARVARFLDSYARVNKRIIVRRVDPKPDSEEEDNARANGLSPTTLPSGEALYMGLLIRVGTQCVTLPVITPGDEPLLEYRVTSGITQLLAPERPKIGLISSLPVLSSSEETEPYYCFTELSRRYAIEQLSLDPYTFSVDPDSLPLIVLFNPQNIPEMVQYRLDQYLLNGGKLLVFLDAFAFVSATPGMRAPAPATFDPFLRHWSLAMMPGPIIDVSAARRETLGGNLFIQNFALKTPEKNFEPNSPVTNALQDLFFLAPGGLYQIAPLPDDLTMTPLVWTSPEATAYPFNLLFEQRAVTPAELPSERATFMLATELSGLFPTAFPLGRPFLPPRELFGADPFDDDVDSAFVSKGVKPGRVILLADVDFTANRAISEANTANFVPANDNFFLFQNCVDFLAGNQDLTAIRVKPISSRPLTRIVEQQKASADAHQSVITKFEDELARISAEIQTVQKSGMQTEGRVELTPEIELKMTQLDEEYKMAARALREQRQSVRNALNALEFRIELINLLAAPLFFLCIGLGVTLVRRYRSMRRSGR